MRFILSTLLCFLLSACVDTGPSRYWLSMQQYQNQSEETLIHALGPPDSSYELDGTRYLTYTKATQQVYSSSGFYGGAGFYNGGFGMEHGFGDDATVQTWRCDVIFAVRNHRVINIGQRGNAC